MAKSNLDKIREQFNKGRGNRGGDNANNYLQIPTSEDGADVRVKVRVMPPWGKGAMVGDVAYPFLTGALHYGFSIGGRPRPLACPEASGKGNCIICTFIGKLRQSNNWDKKYKMLVEKYPGGIKKAEKCYVNVLDRRDNSIKIFSTNRKFINWLLDTSDLLDNPLWDPENGKDIVIVKKGVKKISYEYEVVKKSLPVQVDIKTLHKLDKVVFEWMDEQQMLEQLIANFGQEMKEVGMRPVTNKKKVKNEEEEDQDEGEDEEAEVIEEDEDEEDEEVEVDEDDEDE